MGSRMCKLAKEGRITMRDCLLTLNLQYYADEIEEYGLDLYEVVEMDDREELNECIKAASSRLFERRGIWKRLSRHLDELRGGGSKRRRVDEVREDSDSPPRTKQQRKSGNLRTATHTLRNLVRTLRTCYSGTNAAHYSPTLG